MTDGSSGKGATQADATPKQGGRRRNRMNAEDRLARRATEFQQFAQAYRRKKRRGLDPNDRQYVRGIVIIVRHIRADELDHLVRHGED